MVREWLSLISLNVTLVMMAAFLALMMVAEAIWILGSVFSPFGIGIYYGAVLIIAAIVIGKRYTILTLGIAKTIIMLFIHDTIWREPGSHMLYNWSNCPGICPILFRTLC